MLTWSPSCVTELFVVAHEFGHVYSGHSEYDAALSYVGIELFFVSLELADRASHIIAHGNDDSYADKVSISHPSQSSHAHCWISLKQHSPSGKKLLMDSEPMCHSRCV